MIIKIFEEGMGMSVRSFLAGKKKSDKSIIYHHLGLGDHIICNGLVRTLIQPDTQYHMFVKAHNLTSVSFMYRDLDNLQFIVGQDRDAEDFLKKHKVKKLITAGFSMHPMAKEFDDNFYIQNDLPFELRWSGFKCMRDLESERKIFESYGVKEGEYVFLHDDPKRGFGIDESYIVNRDLPVVRPKHGLTQNIFDYCYLMQHSVESHFIDSSFRLVFDSFQLRNSGLFFHIKLKDSVIKDSSTKSHSKLNFQIIE